MLCTCLSPAQVFICAALFALAALGSSVSAQQGKSVSATITDKEVSVKGNKGSTDFDASFPAKACTKVCSKSCQDVSSKECKPYTYTKCKKVPKETKVRRHPVDGQPAALLLSLQHALQQGTHS